MELCGPGVERDPDLRSEGEQFIDRTLLRRAHVGRRNHADAAATRNDLPGRIAEVVHAGPDHEGADEIDRVGRGQLRFQLGADVRLALSVHQEIALAERRSRQGRQRQRITERRQALDPGQDPRWNDDLSSGPIIRVRHDSPEDRSQHGGLAVGRLVACQLPSDLPHRVPGESLRPLGGIKSDVLPQIRVQRLEQPLQRWRDQMIARSRSEPIRISHAGTLLRDAESTFDMCLRRP